VTSYDLLRDAVVGRRQVRAVYDGLPREFCPHVLGTKEGEAHCLAYQFGGESSAGPITPGATGNWRCFVVTRLTQVSLQDGPWHTAPNWDGYQTCVDRVDVEVEARTEPEVS
jgi:hypothetical protein